MYDYISRKKNIIDILSNSNLPKEVKKIPKNKEFIHEFAGIKVWASVVNVRIINYSEITTNKNINQKIMVLKALNTELIEIMSSTELLREYRVVGENIYAIYSAPLKSNINTVSNILTLINSFFKMFNKILASKKVNEINYCISMSTDTEYIVSSKTNFEEFETMRIDNLIHIGNVVFNSIKMCTFNQPLRIIYDNTSYINFIDTWEKDNENCKSWFTDFKEESKTYHTCSVVRKNFDKWIDEGMISI